ncbi:hypothetical protein [Vibrio misgurnus]|uniref:hypothetical protein n=1 Tax=Vibrio misgurnus TaxID=2993714 RepID=UPI002415EA36|nr:hypothetical protein [Vibrio sp. gvc]
MDSMISSLKDNINSRLTNPFIGAFIFAWISLHIKGVSIFLLVDTQMKIEILRNKDWLLLDDVIYPLFLSLAYLVVLPMLNLLYDRFNSGWLIPKRLELSRKKTVAQVRSETAYIRDYEYENLSSLINAKKKLTDSVSELLEVLDEYRENCSIADQDNFIRLQSVTYELSEVVATVSASDKNNSV